MHRNVFSRIFDDSTWPAATHWIPNEILEHTHCCNYLLMNVACKMIVVMTEKWSCPLVWHPPNLDGHIQKKSNITSEICVCCSSVLKYIISRIPSNAPVWIIYCMTCVRSSNFWGWQILMPYNTEQLNICMFSSYNAGISNTSKCRFETHKVKDSL